MCKSCVSSVTHKPSWAPLTFGLITCWTKTVPMSGKAKQIQTQTTNTNYKCILATDHSGTQYSMNYRLSVLLHTQNLVQSVTSALLFSTPGLVYICSSVNILWDIHRHTHTRWPWLPKEGLCLAVHQRFPQWSAAVLKKMKMGEWSQGRQRNSWDESKCRAREKGMCLIVLEADGQNREINTFSTLIKCCMMSTQRKSPKLVVIVL